MLPEFLNGASSTKFTIIIINAYLNSILFLMYQLGTVLLESLAVWQIDQLIATYTCTSKSANIKSFVCASSSELLGVVFGLSYHLLESPHSRLVFMQFQCRIISCRWSESKIAEKMTPSFTAASFSSILLLLDWWKLCRSIMLGTCAGVRFEAWLNQTLLS